MPDHFECACERCVNACREKPGWMLPGDVEPLAKLLGVSPQELFDTHLSVDWWEDYPQDIYVLSPAVVGGNPGGMFSATPTGQCVFLKDGRCSAHSAKPYECRMLDHDVAQSHERHAWTARQWVGEGQKTIESLLGTAPCSTDFPLFPSLPW